MLNDYECPRCHNIFPSSNRFLHDIKCTASKPVPLNASRVVFENKEKIIPKNNNIFNNQINVSSSENFPKVFYCEICHESMLEKEKNDHMLCHNLENEENNMANDNENDYENFDDEEEGHENNNVGIRLNHNRNNNNLLNINIYPQNNNNYQNIRQNNLARRTNRRNNNNNIFHSNNNRNNNNNQGYRYLGSIRNRAHRNNNNRHPRIYANIQYNNLDNDDEDGEIDNEFDNEEFDEELEEYEDDLSSDGDIYQNPIEQQILDDLPETRIEDINKLDTEKKNCVICLEDFKNGENVINLPCIHLFHKNCIKNWLKNQNSCPICKFKLTKENMN